MAVEKLSSVRLFIILLRESTDYSQLVTLKDLTVYLMTVNDREYKLQGIRGFAADAAKLETIIREKLQ